MCEVIFIIQPNYNTLYTYQNKNPKCIYCFEYYVCRLDLKYIEISTKIKKLDLELIEEALIDCYDNGEINNSLELIDIVLKIQKNNIVALNTLSNIELDNENYLKVIRYANRVLAIDKSNYNALCNKSLARYYMIESL